MNSPNFFTTITIPPGGWTSSANWDPVVSYETYNILIQSVTNLLITVYQDSTPIPSTSTSVKEFLYTASNKTLIVSGELTNSYINYNIKNIGNVISPVKFYVVYK